MKKLVLFFVVSSVFLMTRNTWAEDAAAEAKAAVEAVGTSTTESAITTSESAVKPAEQVVSGATTASKEPLAAIIPAAAPAPAENAVQEAVKPVEPASAAAQQEPAATEVAADNLEFISGEITAMDEAAKTLTVKMYGETTEKESDKILTVTVDTNTDITDGEQDRALKSLTAGTEVDVEYDPATKKATYIFVY